MYCIVKRYLCQARPPTIDKYVYIQGYSMSEILQSESETKKENWINSKWRPMMGWMYMFVCTFDFVLFPILWSIMQALVNGNVSTQWQPITLQGAGLFHISMGAIMGVTAFGRTQEKLAGINNGIKE